MVTTSVVTVGAMVMFGAMVTADTMQRHATAVADVRQRECVRNDDALAGTWDEATRASVSVHFAPLVPALDRWADGWIDAQTMGCTDFARRSVTRPVSAARVRCLESQRVALAGALATLADPTVELAEARTRVDALPRSSMCTGGEALVERFPERS